MGRLKPSRRDRWRHVPAAGVLALGAIPLLFLVMGSLRPTDEPPPRTLDLVPPRFAFENYVEAFERVDLARYLANSLVVVAIAVPLTLACASLAAFAMDRLGGRTRSVLLGMSLVALMVPVTALIVSRVVLFEALGLTDTYVPLVAPALLGTTPFYVLLYYWSFRRIPASLFDAARLEGLGPFGTWWHVALPLVRPTTVAVGALTFVFTWGNVLDPLVYLSDEQRFTVPLGLRALAALDVTEQPIMLAAAVVATLPVIIGLVFVQRWLFAIDRPRVRVKT